MKKVLLSIFVILLAISCQKDIAPESVLPGVGIFKMAPSPLSGSVAGRVVNENDLPLANAIVKIGTAVYTTDDKGMFNSAKLTLDKYISTITVSKPGYFTGYRSFSANATKNYVSIKLIPKTLTGTFASTSTGNISLSNGSSINFQANAIKKNSGEAYNGMVRVYATYIDPTATDFSATMPGSMMAEDANNFYVLRSTGMMAVEMESDAGEPLQLIATKPATMKLSIPATLISKAPSTIDTWSLDSRGIWIKEGTGTKNGNAYDFPVTHFSFWNCDIPTTPVYLNLNLKDPNNLNIPNIIVTLTSSTTFGTTAGMTDSLGNVSGFVPKNETLEMKAYISHFCFYDAFHTQVIGPFSANSSMNIVVPAVSSNSNVWTVTGTATDCTGAPLQNGTVFVTSPLISYYAYYSISNGSFTGAIYSCTPLTSVQILVTDNLLQQQSSLVTIAASGQNFNAGNINVCGNSTAQFINYTLDGTAFSITSGIDSTYFNSYAFGTPLKVNLNGWNYADDIGLSFTTLGTGVGTFTVSSSDSLGVNNYQLCIPQPGATTTFTSYPATVGQFYEGNFNIPFAATGSLHTLTGTFRIRRNQ